ncbi:tyrosine-type recombinase/integrase [Micromonospora chalcea]|uniref:tyrosine-type recombinase/integrase n=1 Tax=Micromonospora chalcea TaxID=1874 RepID=UPI0038073569
MSRGGISEEGRGSGGAPRSSSSRSSVSAAGRPGRCRPQVASRPGRAGPAATSVGLAGLTPHDLRHTAASPAVAAGANVKAVQRMLGHASASMILDV